MADDTVMFSARVPGDLAARFDAVAERMDRSRSWLMVKALEALVDAEERRQAEVAEGFAQLNRGEGVDWDEAFDAEMRDFAGTLDRQDRRARKPTGEAAE